MRRLLCAAGIVLTVLTAVMIERLVWFYKEWMAMPVVVSSIYPEEPPEPVKSADCIRWVHHGGKAFTVTGPCHEIHMWSGPDLSGTQFTGNIVYGGISLEKP